MMLSAMFLCKLLDTIKHDGAYKLWQNLKLAFQLNLAFEMLQIEERSEL